MRKHAIQLWRDDGGFVLSAELVLVLTLGVLAMVVGLHTVAKSVNSELADIANAFGSLQQSFVVNGLRSGGFGRFGGFGGGLHAFVVGSGFIDAADHCDCALVVATSPAIKVAGGGVAGGGIAGGRAALRGAAPAPLAPDCGPGRTHSWGAPVPGSPAPHCDMRIEPPAEIPAPPVLPMIPR